ncbi:14929_t:CDS:1, partial [Racocetra persica]
ENSFKIDTRMAWVDRPKSSVSARFGRSNRERTNLPDIACLVKKNQTDIAYTEDIVEKYKAISKREMYLNTVKTIVNKADKLSLTQPTLELKYKRISISSPL